jgi:hypothetical protein
MKLPKVFAQNRFNLKSQPTVVLSFKDPLVASRVELDYLRESIHTSNKISVWNCWWFEQASYGVLVQSKKCDTLFELSKTTTVRAFYGKGRSKELVMADIISDPSAYDEIFNQVMLDVLWTAVHVTQLVEQAQAHSSVQSGLKPAPRLESYERVRDTLRFAPFDLLARRTVRRPEEKGEPTGIRKREHEVRGHWRHYPSGNKVWIRSHTRGDPDLGTVTRVLTG